MIEEKDLPKGWVYTTLGEICSKPQYGWTTKADREDGQIKLLRTTDISSGLINWDTVPYCTEVPVNVSDYLLNSGDIVISRAGSVGLSYLINTVPLESVFASYLIRFRPMEVVHQRFIAYYLQTPSYWSDIYEQSNGIALANINARKLENLSVPLAPYCEQKRIVEAIEQQFSRLDEGVASLKKAQKRLKSYRAAVLKAAVEGKLTKEWRKAHPDVEPASELLQGMFVERRARWEKEQIEKGRDLSKWRYDEPVKPELTNLWEIPKTWCWATLEQISDANRAITYGVIKLGNPVIGGIPVLRSSNVRHLKLDIDEIKSISPEIANGYRRTFLQGGEILITVRGTLGGIINVPTSLAGYNISREVAMVACLFPSLIRCITFFIGSPTIQAWFQRHTKGIAYTGINIETLKITPIPFPPAIEQEQIISLVEERLSIIDELEKTILKALKQSERLRQSILHQAFTGKLVPQDSDDEPAGELLERIRQEREQIASQEQVKKRTARSLKVSNGTRPINVSDVPPEPIDKEAVKQVSLWDQEDEVVGQGIEASDDVREHIEV